MSIPSYGGGYNPYTLGNSYYQRQYTPLNQQEYDQMQAQQQGQYAPQNPQTGSNIQSSLGNAAIQGGVHYGVEAAMTPAGAAPTTPVVYGASTGATATESPVLGMSIAPEAGASTGVAGAGPGLAGGVGLGAGAIALTQANRAANNYMESRPQSQQNAWAYANSLNPYSWINESIDFWGGKGTSGESLDTDSQLALTVPSFGTVWAYNPTFGRGGIFGSFGNPRAQNRQRWRGYFDEVLGQGRKYTNVYGNEVSIEDYELNPEKSQMDAEAISLMDPIGDAMAQGDKEQREDVVALMAKAVTKGAMSQKDLRQNALNLINQMGFTAPQIREQLRANYENGMITRDRAMVYAQSMATLTNLKPEQEFAYITGAAK